MPNGFNFNDTSNITEGDLTASQPGGNSQPNSQPPSAFKAFYEYESPKTDVMSK